MQTKGLMRSNRWRRTRAGPRRDHSIISAPISRKQAPPLPLFLPPWAAVVSVRAGGRLAAAAASSSDVGAIGGGYEMHICSDRERTADGRTGARESGAGLHAPQESVFWARIIRRPFLARWAVRYGANFFG